MRNTEKNLPLGAAIAALVLSGVVVLTPAQAFADTLAPSPSTAPEAPASQPLVADVGALATFTNVTELADAFASASGNMSIVLSQALTGTTSDPAVSVHPAANVTFDLAGHSLTLMRNDALPALGVPAGATLTIIDSVGGAVLTLDNTGTGAGLGGAGSDTQTTGPGVGTIVVSGVTVRATSSAGAAIGIGARGGTGGTITIADKSDVTATSSGAAGAGAAGIGGAFQGGAGKVNIQSGSTVVASGSMGSAGIGNAQDAIVAGFTTLAIDPVLNSTGTETTVTATGGSNAAGIGNGAGGATFEGGLQITIGGGLVHATGQGDGAGIGSGTGAFPPYITVSGGQVFAVGGSSGPGIGPGAGQYQGGFGLTIGQGAYVEPSSPNGLAVATAPMSGMQIGGTLTIPANNSMTDVGDDWFVTGTLNVDGTVHNQGRFVNTGTINVAGTFNNGIIFNNPGSVINVTGTFNNDSGTITSPGTVNNSSKVTGHNTVVTLHGNGGTPPAQSSTPVYGATYDSVFLEFPGNAVRAGYTFTGWFTAETGGTQVISSTDLFGGGPKTIPLYAQWAPASVGAPGGGSGSGAETGSGTGSGSGAGHGSTSSTTLAATGSNAEPWALGGIALLVAGAAAAAIATLRRKRAS